jgi:hypothetical protein
MSSFRFDMFPREILGDSKQRRHVTKIRQVPKLTGMTRVAHSRPESLRIRDGMFERKLRFAPERVMIQDRAAELGPYFITRKETRYTAFYLPFELEKLSPTGCFGILANPAISRGLYSFVLPVSYSIYGSSSNEWSWTQGGVVFNQTQCAVGTDFDALDIAFPYAPFQQSYTRALQPPDRELTMGYYHQREYRQQDFDSDGTYDNDLVSFTRPDNKGWFRFLIPFWGSVSRPVVFNFAGLNYDRPPEVSLDMSQILFCGKSHRPGTPGSYMLRLNGGKTFSINQGSFTWPSFNQDSPTLIGTYPPFPGVAIINRCTDTHRLSSSGLGVGDITFSFDVTVGKVVFNISLPGCFDGISSKGADQWSQPLGHGKGSKYTVKPTSVLTYSEIVGPLPVGPHGPDNACNEVAISS